MTEVYSVLIVGVILLVCVAIFGYAIVKMVGNDDQQD